MVLNEWEGISKTMTQLQKMNCFSIDCQKHIACRDSGWQILMNPLVKMTVYFLLFSLLVLVH